MTAGSETMTRTWTLVPPSSRRRCGCGCRRRATHFGWGGPAVLTMGCEFYVHTWCRNPITSRQMLARRRAAQLSRNEKAPHG